MQHFMIINMDGYVYLRITDKGNAQDYKLNRRQLALLAEQSVQALSNIIRNPLNRQ